jgi:hypothetical protein
MEDWVLRAIQRWPNVPALFGWLGLTRRGRWLIRGETISRPQIIDTINANYAADEHGRWFFQNGPQRGYIQLESAPLILWTTAGGNSLVTHTGLRVERASTAFLDEEGSLLLATEHGPGLVADSELDWAMQRLECAGKPITEEQLADALQPASGETTKLSLNVGQSRLPVIRLDVAEAPARLGFVRHPEPRAGERASGVESTSSD